MLCILPVKLYNSAHHTIKIHSTFLDEFLPNWAVLTNHFYFCTLCFQVELHIMSCMRIVILFCHQLYSTLEKNIVKHFPLLVPHPWPHSSKMIMIRGFFSNSCNLYSLRNFQWNVVEHIQQGTKEPGRFAYYTMTWG